MNIDFTVEEMQILVRALSNREEYLLVREVEIDALIHDSRYAFDVIKNKTLHALIKEMTHETRALKARLEAKLSLNIESNARSA